MIQRTGEVENLTKHYIFCMGAYRGAYILNWYVIALFLYLLCC
jgi:ER lumen protein retaining receptor